MAEKLVMRHQRLAFMNVGSASSPDFARMTGFTQISDAKNPIEYSRQYVDEPYERADVVGYAPEKAYSFDRHTDNEVHAKIAEITDGELLGDDTHVEIVTVDVFDAKSSGTPAIKRVYSVVPDTSDDGTDALIYSGTFRAVGEIIEGTAATTDGWKTVTFTPSTTA